MNQLKYRKVIFSFFLVLGLLLVSGASAQEVQSDIPEKLLPLAQELGCQTQVDCEAAFNANFTKGLELAEKYNVYTAAQKQAAQSFKSEVLAKLQDVTEENFEEVLVKLAEAVLAKPTVARRLNVTRSEVNAAKTIVAEVKNAGVSLDICRQREESLTREQLIACLKASKELAVKADVVETYIPKQRIEQIGFSSKMAELSEALARGEYPEVGKNAEEAGFNCLRPSSESLKSCDVIAEKYFGPEGVEQLKQARSQVVQTEDYYKKGLETITLITPDNRSIIGKEAIMQTCDQAFTTRNVTLARACGDFAIKNGFASQAEVDEGIKIFESTTQAGIDFSRCRTNPKACEQYIPQEYRVQYQASDQIFQIMAQEGVSPEQCREAEFNPEVGRRCFEGAKRILPKLKELSATSQVAERMVNEIQEKVNQGERYLGKEREFQQTFQTTGGPGGCRTAEECFRFCSNSTNGAECLAFGAKHEVFDRGQVAQRYEQYSQSLTGVLAPIFGESQGTTSFPGTGPYPGFQPPAGQYPGPGQYSGFTAPGPGFQSPPGGGYIGSVGPGPGPECFAAIQSGDFVKAKEICYTTSPTPYPQPSPGPYPGPYPYPSQCPQTVYPSPCPTGQYREQKQDERGCYTYSACVVAPGYVPPAPTCPTLPTVSFCGQDEERYVTFSSQECGQYYACRKKEGSSPTCPTGQYWNGTACVSSGGGCNTYSNQASCVSASERCDWRTSGSTGWCQSATTAASCGNYICESGEAVSCPNDCPVYNPPSCPSGQYWYQPPGSTAQSGYCKPYEGTTTQCDWTSQYFKSATNSCAPRSNCYDTSNSDYNSSECQGVRNTSGQTCTTGQYWNGTACVNQSSPSGQKTQIWNSFGLQSQIRADASQSRVDQLKAACASVSSGANIWMPGAGDYASVDFGMPDPNKCQQAASCTSSQYFNGSSCVSATGTTCPSGQYWNGTSCVSSGSGSMQRCFYPNATRNSQYVGYTVWCEADYVNCHEGSPSGASVSLSGLSLGAPSSCESGWTGGSQSCPSGQYWYTPPSGGAGYCTSSSGSQTCDSALIGLLGSGCHYMYNDSSGNSIFCDGSMTKSAKRGDAATTAGCSSPSTTSCPSGQYWNGTSCVNTSPTDCPSGQYWYTPPSGGAGYCTSNSGTTTSGSCTAELTNLLGSGCHDMGNAWFNGEMTQYVSPGTTQVKSCSSDYISGCTSSSGSTSCPSGQYWNGASCVSSTSGTTCPSGQYWDGSACICPSGTTWSGSTCSSGGTSSCSSGQYWNGSSCVSSSGNYSSDPATACAQAGGSWDASTNYCQMPGGSSGGYSSDPATGCAQAGGTWYASSNYCQMPGSPPPSGGFLTPRYMIAHINSILNQLSEVLRGLLR